MHHLHLHMGDRRHRLANLRHHLPRKTYLLHLQLIVSLGPLHRHPHLRLPPPLVAPANKQQSVKAVEEVVPCLHGCLKLAKPQVY